MRLIAIDPGTTESGVIVFGDNAEIKMSRVLENAAVISLLRLPCCPTDVVIEMIASYGMAVGRTTFETVVWIGRFMETCHREQHVTPYRMYRKEVKLHLCGQSRAKDANIWQAIVDRYGGKEAAIGKKKHPGPLYGVTSHARAALALGLTFIDGVRSDDL